VRAHAARGARWWHPVLLAVVGMAVFAGLVPAQASAAPAPATG